MIHVLCVDDHALVREGIARVISRVSDVEVVGLAASGHEAIEFYRQHRPDVVLMDLQMRDMSGVEAIKAIRAYDHSARIIVVTVLHADEDIYQALHAGAATYLMKDTVSDELIRVIREVYSDTYVRPPSLEMALSRRAHSPHMTAREIQVLELIGHGLRNKGVAEALGISEETVQVHVRNIFSKLGLQDRSAAITAAVRLGLIDIRLR
jgi:two-component system NarL family response regulator